MRVDFYVLPHSDPHQRLVFACRLAEKAYHLQNRVFINTESRAQAQQLDELMWTFRDGSFVPHDLYAEGSAPEDEGPILVAHEAAPHQSMDLLINLVPAVPAFLDSFERLAELVDADAGRRTAARERFKYYRDQGFALETHNLG